MLDPIKAIESTGGIVDELQLHVGNLAEQLEEIAAQWKQLGKHGAQRADHASVLLQSIRPHLQSIASFASDVDSQLAELKANPFGDEG